MLSVFSNQTIDQHDAIVIYRWAQENVVPLGRNAD